MAKKQVEIVLKAKDLMSRRFKTISKNWNRMVKTIMGGAVTRAFRFVMNSIKKMIELFIRLAKYVTAAGAAIAVFSTKIGSDLGKSMSRVKALTGATEEQFEALNYRARELGRTTEWTASQVAQAMGEMALAGYEVNEIITAMPGILNLASAGQLDIAEAASIATGVMGGMQLQANDLQRAVDVMAKAFTTSRTDLVDLGEAMKMAGPIAAFSGKSLEDVVAALQVLAQAGFKGEQAGTALRNIFVRMTGATGGAKKTLEEMIGTLEDTTGGMRPLADIVGDMVNSFRGIGNVEKQARLMEVFGLRAGPAMAGMLGQGEASLRLFREALIEVGGTADNIAKTQLDNLRGDLTRLTSVLYEVGYRVYDVFSDRLRTTVQSLREWVINNQETFLWWSEKIYNYLIFVKDLFVTWVDYMKKDWVAGLRDSLLIATDLIIAFAKSLVPVIKQLGADLIHAFTASLLRPYYEYMNRAEIMDIYNRMQEENARYMRRLGKRHKYELSSKEEANIPYPTSGVMKRQQKLMVYEDLWEQAYREFLEGRVDAKRDPDRWKKAGEKMRAEITNGIAGIELPTGLSPGFQQAYSNLQNRLANLTTPGATPPPPALGPGGAMRGPGAPIVADQFGGWSGGAGAAGGLAARESRFLSYRPGAKGVAEGQRQTMINYLKMIAKQYQQGVDHRKRISQSMVNVEIVPTEIP